MVWKRGEEMRIKLQVAIADHWTPTLRAFLLVVRSEEIGREGENVEADEMVSKLGANGKSKWATHQLICQSGRPKAFG